MMIRVIYTSQPTPGLSREQLEELLRPVRDHALTYNALHHLTGALAYSEHFFAQVLEGEEIEIETLVARIAKSPRHKDFKLLDKRTVENRAFPDWSMAFCFDPDFSAFGMSVRDVVSYLIEAAQYCNKVRAIPGYSSKSGAIGIG